MKRETQERVTSIFAGTIAAVVMGGIALASVWGVYKLGTRNVDDVKAHASAVWKDNGYEIAAYEGYEWGPLTGGAVWYHVRKSGNDNTLYNGFLCRWGSEYHIYSFKAIDALKPRN